MVVNNIIWEHIILTNEKIQLKPKDEKTQSQKYVCVSVWQECLPYSAALQFAFWAQNTIEIQGDTVEDFHFVPSQSHDRIKQ